MKLAPEPPEALSETEHQKLCVAYAERIGLGPYLLAIPNGTQLAGTPSRRARYMASLKAMGLKPGASDLFLAKPVQFAPGKWHHGAWFEMKRIKGGRTSEDQKKFLYDMADQGYYADVCNGFDAFYKSLTRYLSGLPSRLVI
jgi:hypothetical protein